MKGFNLTFSTFMPPLYNLHEGDGLHNTGWFSWMYVCSEIVDLKISWKIAHIKQLLCLQSVALSYNFNHSSSFQSVSGVDSPLLNSNTPWHLPHSCSPPPCCQALQLTRRAPASLHLTWGDKATKSFILTSRRPFWQAFYLQVSTYTM